MINKQKNSIRVMAGVLSFTLMFGNISSVALTDTNNRVVCAEESEGLLKEIKRKENKIFCIKKELERINDEKIQVSNCLKDIEIIREYEKAGFASKSLCDKKIKEYKEYQEHLNQLFEKSKKLEAQVENEKKELAQLRLCKLTVEKKVKEARALHEKIAEFGSKIKGSETFKSLAETLKSQSGRVAGMYNGVSNKIEELSKRNDTETETETKEEVINLFETTKRDESKEQFRENIAGILKTVKESNAFKKLTELKMAQDFQKNIVEFVNKIKESETFKSLAETLKSQSGRVAGMYNGVSNKIEELSKRNDTETETETKEEVINLFETTKRDEFKEQFRENKPKDGDTEKRLRKDSNECLLLFYEYIKAAKVLKPESSEIDDEYVKKSV